MMRTPTGRAVFRDDDGHLRFVIAKLNNPITIQKLKQENVQVLTDGLY